MRQTAILCDCCGATCPRDFSVLELDAGPIRSTIGRQLDLCQGCVERLSDWLRSGKASSEEGIGGALQDTAVASLDSIGIAR